MWAETEEKRQVNSRTNDIKQDHWWRWLWLLQQMRISTAPRSVSLWRLTALPFAERHQLSLVGRQRHGVHALGRRRGRWRHCGARVRVHGRQRRMAQGGLRDAAAWGPVSRPSTKSVVVVAGHRCGAKGSQCDWPPSCPSHCAGSKLFRSETVCPPTTVKFERGCYHFEPVVYKRTFKESREHCRLIGWYTCTQSFINACQEK